MPTDLELPPALAPVRVPVTIDPPRVEFWGASGRRITSSTEAPRRSGHWTASAWLEARLSTSR